MALDEVLGRAVTPTLAFPVCFLFEALDPVMYLSERSEQLDVTLESSKIVKQTDALTWVVTTQSDAIK
jgi:hypothetical protein